MKYNQCNARYNVSSTTEYVKQKRLRLKLKNNAVAVNNMNYKQHNTILK